MADAIRLELQNGKADREPFEILAARSRWYIDAIVDATKDTPFELIYKNRDHDTKISYIEDDMNRDGSCFVLIDGTQAKQIAKLIQDKVGALPIEDN